MFPKLREITSLPRALVPSQWRGRAYLWLYVLIALTFLTAAANAAVVRLGGGDAIGIATFFHGSACSAAVFANGNTYFPGACIIELNGRSTASGYEVQRQLQELGPGQAVELRILHPDGRVERRSDRTRVSPLYPWMTAVGSVWLLLGLAVLWFRPEGGAPFVIFVLCECVGLNLFVGSLRVHTEAAAQWAVWWQIGFSNWGIYGGGIAFALQVPYVLPVARRWGMVGIVLSGALGVGLVCSVVYLMAPQFWWIVDRASPVFFGFMLISCFAAGVSRLRSAQPPRVAAQLRLLMVAFVFAGPIVGVRAAEEVAGTRFSPQIEYAASAMTVVLAFVLVYLVITHDILAIDRMTTKIVARGGSFLLLFAIYTLAVVTLPLMNERGAGAVASRSWALPGVALVLGGVWLTTSWALDRVVTSALSRTQLSFEARVRAFNRVFETLAVQPLHQARPYVELALTEALGSRVELWERLGADGWRVPSSRSSDTVMRTSDDLRRDGGVLIPIRHGAETLAGIAVRGSRSHALDGPDHQRLLKLLESGTAHALGFARRRRQIGSYKLTRFLGAGGMGAVYLGQAVGLYRAQEKAAIKRILTSVQAGSPQFERFMTEAKIAQQLVHPNIVRAFEVGETDDGPFLAMEYVSGCDARQLLEGLRAEGALLEIDSAVEIVSALCRALAYAHAGDPVTRRPGLLHRDVSPENVLISQDGDVKLADFGIATFTEAAQSTFSGKPGYLAPELLAGAGPSPVTDIYSAGVVLYELLVGEHPFRRRSVLPPRASIYPGRWVRAASLREDVSLELSEIVDRATTKEPEERFPSSNEMLNALVAARPCSQRDVAAELGKLAIRYGALAHQQNHGGNLSRNATTVTPQE